MPLNHTSSDKAYYSFNDYCKESFHQKLYKAAIDGGFTCPVRDGKLDTRGCIFCSAKGSGDFAVSTFPNKTVSMQIDDAIMRLKDKPADGYIAYFQAFTNTYKSAEELRSLYLEALSHERVFGISIATRPDCLSDEILDLLCQCKKAFPSKFIWIELGLQTMHESTAQYIRRGYSLPVMTNACEQLAAIDIPVIVHVIIGLPGESPGMLLETIAYVNSLPIWGVKLQLLHVLKGTDLAADYYAGKFDVLSEDAYIDLLIECIEHLRADIVIHRVTGDGPKDLTIAPLWSLHKRAVLNHLHKEMKRRGSFQGKSFKPF